MKWSIFSMKLYVMLKHGSPCINNKVKKAIQKKNELFSSVKSNINNGTLLKKLQCLQNKLNDLMDAAKIQCFLRISMKLMDPTASVKTYWSILKRCRNDKKIPPILGKKPNF